MNWIIDYNIIASVIVAMVLSVYFIRDRFKNRVNGLFIALAVDVLIASTLDTITLYTNSTLDATPLWFSYLLNIICCISFTSISVLFYIYVIVWVKKESISVFNRSVALISFLFPLVVFISSPYTHWGFYFENNTYHQGKLVPVLFILASAILILALCTAFIHRNRIERVKRYTVYVFAVMVAGSLLIQMIYPEIILTNLLASLFVLVIYLTLHDPETYLDKKTECLNKKAFYSTIRDQLMINESGSVLFLDFEGLTFINRMIGVKASNEMVVNIAEFLRRAFGRKNVYHLESSKFTIMLESKYDTRKAAERISFYYNQEEMYKDIHISWIPKMCIVSYPEMATTLEDILDIIRYFEEEKLNANTSIVVADEMTLSGKKRKNLVRQAVNRAIKAKSFELYFQPIIDAKTEKVVSAEALVRLNDSKLGFISPDEFIIEAEEYGCIIDVDRIVLEKVCDFISAGNLKQYGIDYVEVNLSVVELMQENLAKDIFKVMDAYGISHDQINFEITETAYLNTDATFTKNINQIVEMGSSISMDDYGTGFSNSWNLTKFPYHFVKLDKSILWEAVKSKTAYIVLENSVQILKKINRGIVVEGVETKEQVKLLQEMQVDKLQGYYYSRPLPKEEFIEFLKRSQEGGRNA